MPKGIYDRGEVTPVDTIPEVVLDKNLVSIHIDRQMTDGGIRVNGKLYVGTVKVSEEQAKDLLRIQEEYFETKKKLMDKYAVVRMKSDDQKLKLFLAEPSQNENKRGFTRDYGLLGALEWSYLNDKAKEMFLDQRRQLYGY